MPMPGESNDCLAETTEELDAYLAYLVDNFPDGYRTQIWCSSRLRREIGGEIGLKEYFRQWRKDSKDRKKTQTMAQPDFELDEIHQAQTLLTNS